MELKRAFDFLYYQVETYPKSDCFAYKIDGKWKRFSTQDVIDVVNKMSLGFLEAGIARGDKVAIISENRPAWNFTDLALQQIGAVSVPMYPTITVEDYRYIFDHAEVKMIFVSNEDIFRKAKKAAEGLSFIKEIYSYEKVEGARYWAEIAVLGQDRNPSELDPLKDFVQEDDMMTIIYTSGTTGRPKGVMLSHRNVVSNAIAVSGILPLEQGKSRALSFLPLCHIYERTGVYLYLYLGTSVYYAENLETIGDNLKEVKPDIFTTVPRLLEKIYDKIVSKGMDLKGIKKRLFFWALNLGLKYEPSKEMGGIYNAQLKVADKLVFSKWREALGNNVKAITSGAAALQPRLARVFWAAGIKVCEGYGLTETSPVIAANLVTKEGVRVGTVGPVIGGVQVKIASDGEVLCKGPNVMMGYYKQPDLTASAIDSDGWFHTGDIGEMVEGRFLKITDRKKEMFKTSGGKYIAPQLLENKFKESFFIEQIAVIGNDRKFPSALIVPNFEALRDWCEHKGIHYTSDAAMVFNKDIKQKVDKEVARLNEEFAQWEKIKKYTLLADLWSVETGELTPTMKLKRRVIDEKYKREIEEMYI
ncbi:long-chain fatty acid--CoA ligase [Limibacter armeniacum]|uniref:AMP-dependent synthetase/ligase n=1 Tax=Limibacter armeniacum TaxID=466084 RepID=UPI002FE596DF